MKLELSERLTAIIEMFDSNGYKPKLEIKSGHKVVLTLIAKDTKEALAIAGLKRKLQ